ncbi:MAG: DUF1015 domain-containing protein [Cytophagales bacterium]|nr:MAG: DUF1015 domain-containing protein [Cytophagales bacterium]TAF62073.1 MAG: DUF1015 domain-containing protein [Cytophagales bacterium]
MAEIIPFRGWRYHPRFASQIQNLVSPLFDVVSAKQRTLLYNNPFNSIHLSVPKSENPAQQAAMTLAHWKADKVIVQDKKPSIYVYYQYFNKAGTAKTLVRKGFMVYIKATSWEEPDLMRHENTIPLAVNDRTEILRATNIHASATHGLYHDPEFVLEKYLDEAVKHNLIYETEDYQGVRDAIAVIDEPSIIQIFIDKIRTQQIVLADGHHRYESSQAVRQERMAANPNHTGKELYNYHLMYLTNSAADDLRILPTHRLLYGLESLTDENTVMQKVALYFKVRYVENASDLAEIIAGKKWAFGLVFPENAYFIQLKPDMINELKWQFPDAVKELDLTVLHYFFIELVAGIKGHAQRASANIQFERNYVSCLEKVGKQEVQLALIVNEIHIDEVHKVCKTGFTMPQKSTYFYPKVLAGLVFGEIDNPLS